MSIHIDFLSYDGERNNERHPHAQFVLPIAGELRIDIGGAESMLDPSRAAFVAPGVRHSQLATGSNRFLIVNCDPAECGVPVAERLAEQVFLPVSEAMRHLIGFANLSRDRFALPGMPQCWMPLLIDSIFGHERRTSRLDELAERIEADLSAPWTVEEMARPRAACTRCSARNGGRARRHGSRKGASGACRRGWPPPTLPSRSWRSGRATPTRAP